MIKESEATGKLRSDHYLVTTLVSSPMARALAEREGVRIEDDLLVGFKWIAHRIDEAGPASFLFAFEESHGYLKGTHARDKDAAVGALLFAELAAAVKDRKQTVLEYLDDLYIDVGHHGDRLINKTFEGREGLAKIQTLMEAFRDSPAAADRRIDSHGGLRLQDSRDPVARPLGASPSPAPPVRRSAHLSHRATRDPIRGAAVGNRAEDQVLPLRADRRRRPRSPARRQGRDRAPPRPDGSRPRTIPGGCAGRAELTMSPADASRLDRPKGSGVRSKTARVLVDPRDQPAAGRAEGVFAQLAGLDPAGIDEARTGLKRRGERCCQVHDQLDSVVGDAVGDGLDRRSDSNADPGDALDATRPGRQLRRSQNLARRIDPREVDGREFPELLPQPSEAALHDQDLAVAHDDRAGFRDGRGRRFRRRYRQPVLKPEPPGLAEVSTTGRPDMRALAACKPELRAP